MLSSVHSSITIAHLQKQPEYSSKDEKEDVEESQKQQNVVVALVQLLSHVQIFVTPLTATCQASLSFTMPLSLLKLMSTESVMPSNQPILCRPLLLLSVFPNIRAFFNELALRIRWPKYLSFSFSVSPSNEYSVLISFRVD